MQLTGPRKWFGRIRVHEGASPPQENINQKYIFFRLIYKNGIEGRGLPNKCRKKTDKCSSIQHSYKTIQNSLPNEYVYHGSVHQHGPYRFVFVDFCRVACVDVASVLDWRQTR
jgi:hypothetical protein